MGTYYAGKDASITVGVTTYAFAEWQGSFEADVLNTTVFGNASKTNMVGLKFGSVTLRGPHFYGAMAVTQGSQITVSLKLSGTTIATGTLTVQRIEVQANANDGSQPTTLAVSGPTSGDWTLTLT